MEHIAFTINPKNDTECGQCPLLQGINFASCRAGFQPEFRCRETLRPQACRDAVREQLALEYHFASWGLLP